MKNKLLLLFLTLITSVFIFASQPELNAAVQTVQFTLSPQGNMVDGKMPVTFQAVGEQPTVELIASNLENIRNVSLVIDDYQNLNNYTDSLDLPLAINDFITFNGSDSAIGVKLALDNNGFLYHYATIGEGASITLSFDIDLLNTTNYVQITYMLDGEVFDTKMQKKDDIPNSPLDPTKYGYEFKGWYLEPEFTTPISLSTRFELDSTVYGKYVEKTLIIVKYYDGETVISQSTQYTNELLLKPDNPIKSGHIFIGWYLEPDFTTKLENEDVFESDVNIYAKFIADTGGGLIVEEESTITQNVIFIVGGLMIVVFLIGLNNSKKQKKGNK